MTKSIVSVSVVIPNLNGKDGLKACLDSLLVQTLPAHIIVVENGSTDGSLSYLQDTYADMIEILPQKHNLGFAGGVNVGIRASIERGDKYVALFNNDAIADPKWLEGLIDKLEAEPQAGIAACRLLKADGKTVDSTGEEYSIWGLPFPYGRDTLDSKEYSESRTIFGGSGGASAYRVAMLKEIGIFDEDFFAYYEDVDISFRAQLAGWKAAYEPRSIVRHATGSTGSKIKGFYTLQTFKNLPMVALKNVPDPYRKGIVTRLNIALSFFFVRAIGRGQGFAAIEGYTAYLRLRSKKILERKQIQSTKKVSDEYIWSIITHDLPPNAHALRKLRTLTWKLRGKKV